MWKREGGDIVGSNIAQYAQFGYRVYQVLKFWVLKHDSTIWKKDKDGNGPGLSMRVQNLYSPGMFSSVTP